MTIIIIIITSYPTDNSQANLNLKEEIKDTFTICKVSSNSDTVLLIVMSTGL